MNPIKYSICITHFNNGPTMRGSLESIFNQIDDRFEVVIVDNFSNDGSESILKQYFKEDKIRLIQKKCTRGFGRNTALKEAKGDYIFSGLDMDDTFKPRLGRLLEFYHASCEGSLLFAETATILAPRKFLLDLGGWRDLQYNETWELCKRAAKAGKYQWTIFPLLESVNKHPERKTLVGRIQYRHLRIRDNYRVGHRAFSKNERIGIPNKILQAFTLLTLPFYKSYRDGFKFAVVAPKYFIDSSDWWADLKSSEEQRDKYKKLLGKQLQ